MASSQPGLLCSASLCGMQQLCLWFTELSLYQPKKGIKDNDVDGFDNNVLAIVKSLHWTGVQHILSDHISDSCVGNKKIITVDVKAH